MKRRFITALILVLTALGCNNADDAVDLINGPSRKTIDVSKLGINAFFNDSRFGSISSQAEDIHSSLKLNRMRILARWDNGMQPSQGGAFNFGLIDEIFQSVSTDTKILIIATGHPSWGPKGSEARSLFVDSFVSELLNRYGSDQKFEALQIWNEPNDPANTENSIMGFIEGGVPSAENYVEVLSRARNAIDAIAPRVLLLNASSTAINQNYPNTLDYNRALRDAGAQSLVDVWAVHYYGQQFENLLRNGGVKEFADGLDRPIWITESGAQGVNEQLKYGEETWPYLFDKLNSLQRVYIYQYAENSPSGSTYGLRNPSDSAPVSDLYVSLRDN